MLDPQIPHLSLGMYSFKHRSCLLRRTGNYLLPFKRNEHCDTTGCFDAMETKINNVRCPHNMTHVPLLCAPVPHHRHNVRPLKHKRCGYCLCVRRFQK